MPDLPRVMTAALHQEVDWYVAQCLEVDVASQGRSIDEALANLAEAVELHLEEIDDPEGHLTATPLVTSFKLPSAYSLPSELTRVSCTPSFLGRKACVPNRHDPSIKARAIRLVREHRRAPATSPSRWNSHSGYSRHSRHCRIRW